jgi:hypothetical protein
MGQCCAACIIKLIRGRGIEVYAHGSIVAVCFGASECEEVAGRRQDGLAFLHLIIIRGCLSTHPTVLHAPHQQDFSKRSLQHTQLPSNR